MRDRNPIRAIYCELCDERIALADLFALKRPLMGNQFIAPGEGYSDPFPADTTWEWFRCPICRMRPFICTDEQIEQFVLGAWAGPEKVRTKDGFYVIGSSEIPGESAERVCDIQTDEELEREWNQRMYGKDWAPPGEPVPESVIQVEEVAAPAEPEPEPAPKLEWSPPSFRRRLHREARKL